MKKKVTKEMLSEDIKRFKSLINYDFYDNRNKVNESFPILSLQEDEEENQPEGLDDLEAEIDADLEGQAPEGQESPTDAPVPTEEPLDLPAEEEPLDTPMDSGEEIELDVTELVKGSEAAKQSADAANSKIEQLMSMVDKLENQLNAMNTITAKIENLEKEIEMRNPTPKEKLEMRSLDSYPYNVKLTDFWKEKSDKYDIGMEEKQPEEYVLTQQDVDSDYSESDIEGSFGANENI
jgi:hypothetical protein